MSSAWSVVNILPQQEACARANLLPGLWRLVTDEAPRAPARPSRRYGWRALLSPLRSCWAGHRSRGVGNDPGFLRCPTSPVLRAAAYLAAADRLRGSCLSCRTLAPGPGNLLPK